jgi:hypothetical protein
VSNFIINLVRRGAGLAPQVPVEPPFTPVFLPGPGGLAPWEAPGANVSAEAERASDNEGLNPPGKIQEVWYPPAQAAPAPPQISPGPPALSPAEPLAGISSPPPEKPPRPPLLSPPGEAVAAQTRVWTPKLAPQGNTQVLEAPADANQARADYSSPQPAPTEAVRPRPIFQPAVLKEIPGREKAKVFHPEPRGQTPDGPQPWEAARIAPDRRPESEPRQPLIRPAPVKPPEPLIPEKASMPPAVPRPIQVRIGTIEVRAITPPAPASAARSGPSPQGFEAYRLLRSYASFDEG